MSTGVVKPWLLVGPVITTAGGILVTTLMFLTEEIVIAPSLSVACAVSTYSPASTLLHTKPNGALVASPTLFVPAKNSTRLIVPSASAAVAPSRPLAGTKERLPFVGEVKVMLGGRLL